MSLLGVCQWLADTQWSIALHESIYGYPIVESIHVWALCVFVGLAFVLDLRLTGLTFKEVPVSQITRRILPWIVAGFVAMVVSGILLFYAIPVRSYQNIFFRAKLVLLLLAGVNVWFFHSKVLFNVQQWDRDPLPPPRARRAGLASILLWMTIIVFGRLIAYNWFDCDKPQSRLVNTLEGCVVH
jgi:hypothetical protein